MREVTKREEAMPNVDGLIRSLRWVVRVERGEWALRLGSRLSRFRVPSHIEPEKRARSGGTS